MRKFIITICLLGSAFLILQSAGFLDTFLLFLMAGIIPGTNTPVSPTIMLIAISAIAGLVVIRSVGVVAYRYVTLNRLARQYMKKKRPSKRRLSHA